MDHHALIDAWWATLRPDERIDARAAVEAGALPHWMATALVERLGSHAVTTWWEGDVTDHPAPYRTTSEIADIIASQAH